MGVLNGQPVDRVLPGVKMLECVDGEWRERINMLLPARRRLSETKNNNNSRRASWHGTTNDFITCEDNNAFEQSRTEYNR